MFAFAIVSLLVVGTVAFKFSPAIKPSNHALSMALTAPGKNMKPQFDGTFKEAGAPLEVYVLEHENGARALVDTKTATCISWVDQNGVQVIGGKDNAHRFPNPSTVLDGEFFPEERAKKVSFDRMIFKTHSSALPDIEYRADVTLRADCLEYDITIINLGTTAPSVEMGLSFNIAPDAAAKGAKVVSKKGYTVSTDNSVTTPVWSIPVGKFKETTFFAKISSTSK
eukprot:gene8713-11774_t